jgi:hypothetical protein
MSSDSRFIQAAFGPTKSLIHRYLETILPELAALAENRSLDSVGPSLVISIGAPKAK